MEKDKLIEIYTIRIPTKTKQLIDSLPSYFQRKLREELRLTMARIIHEYVSFQNFRPETYLGEINLEIVDWEDIK